MMRRLRFVAVAFTLIFSMVALVGVPAYAGRVPIIVLRVKANAGQHVPTTDYIVNSLTDTNDGSCDLNLCSLRDAIASANVNAGADTITFMVSGTITLTSSLPPISDTLVIDGSGQSITVSGANANQVMHINDGATVTLDTLTITNGASAFGGGLDNGGTLTVTNSTVAGNSATYGGGLDNRGVLTVMNSTFSGNSATYGGGLANEPAATAVITNTTFSGNSAIWPCPCPGGGAGGGIYNSGTLAVTNSTLSGNWMTGGGAGGGIGNFGTMTVRNTIIASSGGGNCAGTVTVTNGGNNLDSDGSCGWGSGNGSLSNINPRLGPLADNGGDTPTMMLLPDSPAIDGVTFNAPNGCPATDQRGVARPIGPRCDIGAFESKIMTHTLLPLIVKAASVAQSGAVVVTLTP